MSDPNSQLHTIAIMTAILEAAGGKPLGNPTHTAFAIYEDVRRHIQEEVAGIPIEMAAESQRIEVLRKIVEWDHTRGHAIIPQVLIDEALSLIPPRKEKK